MIAAFHDWNMSVDGIEQFFNRVRRTDTAHIECAKVILPKQKAPEAYLLDKDGNRLCEFHDVVVENDIVFVKDTSQMDGVPYGDYRMELVLYGGKREKNLYIQPCGDGNVSTVRMLALYSFMWKGSGRWWIS